jgi:hypothetical protein
MLAAHRLILKEDVEREVKFIGPSFLPEDRGLARRDIITFSDRIAIFELKTVSRCSLRPLPRSSWGR